MIDLQTATAEDVFYTMDGKPASPAISHSPPVNHKLVRKDTQSMREGGTTATLGKPVKVLSFEENRCYSLCYQRKEAINLNLVKSISSQ